MGLREDRAKEKAKKQEEHAKHTEYMRSLIWAMYDSGYSIAEIANRLNIPKLNVKLHLTNGPINIRVIRTQ